MEKEIYIVKNFEQKIENIAILQEELLYNLKQIYLNGNNKNEYFQYLINSYFISKKLKNMYSRIINKFLKPYSKNQIFQYNFNYNL